MLLHDRFVGTFGVVAPGDREQIVKIAVAAVRNGFAVVPMQADAINPACALTAAAAKKDPDHNCYHVLTEDTKTRPAFQRLTKDGGVVNLAIDVAASNIAYCTGVDWWNGPEISPTLLGLDGEEIYIFDTRDYEGDIPPGVITKGTLLVPPTADDESGDYIQLVGQMNYLLDHNPEGTEETMASPADLWNPAKEEEMSLRIESLENTVTSMGQALDDLRAEIEKLKKALIAGLTAMKEIKDTIGESG